MWALTPPGYLQDWHLGVRTLNNNKLVGFITAIPADISVHDRVQPMVEINFLCVHKKIRSPSHSSNIDYHYTTLYLQSIRSKRLAPVLIKEITRRVNLQNRWQAVYTAGVVIPKPVSRCRYWHRSLNPKKLYEVIIYIIYR
jgi:glycylpeptide N-tetradecanoyltransferase